MTVKRDLKRRVRQRQARTGEAYVTARRHVLAARAGAPPEDPPGEAGTATEPDTGRGDATVTADTGEPTASAPRLVVADPVTVAEPSAPNELAGGVARLAVADPVTVAEPSAPDELEGGVARLAVADPATGAAGPPVPGGHEGGAPTLVVADPATAAEPSAPGELAGGAPNLTVVDPAAGGPSSRGGLERGERRVAADPATEPSGQGELEDSGPSAGDPAAGSSRRGGLAVGDAVRVIDGPFAGYPARIDEVLEGGQKVKVSLIARGQHTSVELDPAQVHGPVASARERRVLDLSKDEAQPPSGARSSAVPVVELVDVTVEAWRLGFMCRVTMFPGLIERIEPGVALLRLRELLVETAGDPQMMPLSRIALTPPQSAPIPFPGRPGAGPLVAEGPESLRRFLRRARAGMGGVSEGGGMLAFHAAGRDGIVPILCAMGAHDASIVLSAIDDLTAEAAGIELQLTVMPRRAFVSGRPAAIALGPTLSVICDGRWYAITHDEFLIGRGSKTVHLAIKDGVVSRRHAVVIRRAGVYYLKDLGSAHGIVYKGMRIDNKRIDEGDVFHIGEHELRFTFQSDEPDK